MCAVETTAQRHYAGLAQDQVMALLAMVKYFHTNDMAIPLASTSK